MLQGRSQSVETTTAHKRTFFLPLKRHTILIACNGGFDDSRVHSTNFTRLDRGAGRQHIRERDNPLKTLMEHFGQHTERGSVNLKARIYKYPEKQYGSGKICVAQNSGAIALSQPLSFPQRMQSFDFNVGTSRILVEAQQMFYIMFIKAEYQKCLKIQFNVQMNRVSA